MAIGPSFDDVLAAAQAGTSWAFDRLYLDLAPPVGSYVRLQGIADWEDVTSEVFLSVFASLRQFSGGEAQFRSWVFTIAYRRIVDVRRQSGRAIAVLPLGDALLEGPGGDVEEEAFDALGTQLVIDLCNRLSEDQRTVILLRVLGDFSVEQIADLMGKTQGAVKRTQRRALDSLRKKIGLTRYP